MLYPLPYFNSIKVRLELKTIAGFAAPVVFQFHKGTIRTLKIQNMLKYGIISIP